MKKVKPLTIKEQIEAIRAQSEKTVQIFEGMETPTGSPFCKSSREKLFLISELDRALEVMRSREDAENFYAQVEAFLRHHDMDPTVMVPIKTAKENDEERGMLALPPEPDEGDSHLEEG